MAGEKKVAFTESAAQRVAAATLAYEAGNRSMSPIKFRQPGDDGEGASVRLGKTTTTWSKGTVASIELYEEGTPPNETKNATDYTLADCVNKFADVQNGKWVMVAQMTNGRWYLIAAEC